jgi:ABC-type lipopolysaccharide export system ATPase subunit
MFISLTQNTKKEVIDLMNCLRELGVHSFDEAFSFGLSKRERGLLRIAQNLKNNPHLHLFPDQISQWEGSWLD